MHRHLGWLRVVYALAFVAVSIATGVQHDYGPYLHQWAATMDGQDPWSTDVAWGRNAYGPLHLVFAPMAAIHPLLPKIVTAILWLVATDRVVRIVLASERAASVRAVLLVLLPFNPFLWVWVATYGSNDAVVGALLTLVLTGAAGRPRRGAAIVGAAALLKIYPLFVLPFVATAGRRIRWPMVAVAGGIFVAGYAAVCVVWGASPFGPLAFAVSRDAKLLSIWTFLADSALVPGPSHGRAVRKIAQIVFAATGLACYAWFWWRGYRSAIHGAAIALLVILTTYHLGNFQFYIPFIPVAVLLIATDGRVRPPLTIALVLAIATVSALGTLYQFTGGLRASGYAFLRVESGALTFLFDAWALALLLAWPREAPRGRLLAGDLRRVPTERVRRIDAEQQEVP